MSDHLKPGGWDMTRNGKWSMDSISMFSSGLNRYTRRNEEFVVRRKRLIFGGKFPSVHVRKSRE
jgi:hypothetical protein